MKFNICVPIPVKAGNLKESEATIKKALEAKPDFVELRLDYISDIRFLTKEFAIRLLNLVQPTTPTIFTFRDFSEGGQMKVDNKERLEVLKDLIKARPEFFDIEMNSDKYVLEEIISLAKQNKIKLIFSYHDFKKTPSYEKANEIIEKFTNNLTNNLNVEHEVIIESVYKAIFTAQSFNDNLIPLKLCKSFSQKGRKVICFCMGEMGIFSRIMCVKAGSFLTFGSFEEQTAPGQLSIQKIREIQRILFE